MKKLSPVVLAVVWCMLFTGHAAAQSAAQSEKVTISSLPRPNQTARMVLTQEADFDLTFEGTPALPAMKISVKSVMEMTQKTGTADNQGRLETELTTDQVKMEIAVNGAAQSSDETSKKLVGKKFKVTHTGKGEIIDVKVPDDMPLPPDFFKDMLKSLSGQIPNGEMSIGETATTPFDVKLPLPIPNAEPMKLDGTAKTKLVAVTKEADGRIAQFTRTIDAKLNSSADVDSPSGKIKMGFNLKMSGGGTTQFNLDKGLPKVSDAKLDYDGTVSIDQPGSTQSLTIILKGIMKIGVSGAN